MSFELTTIILFFLITPGYSFFQGMKNGCRFGLKAENLSIKDVTEQAIFFSVISSFIFIFIVPASIAVLEWVWHFYDRNFLETLFSENPFLRQEDAYSFHYDLWFSIAAVYILTILISYFLGACFIKKIESGSWPLPIFHGAHYELIKGKVDPIIFCSVLTNIQHDNCLLMYKGRLKDISYLSKNKIEYLSMSQTRRFLMKIETARSARSTATIGDAAVTYFDDLKRDATELFFIDGQNVANILFSKVPIQFPTEHTCIFCRTFKFLRKNP